MLCRQHRLTAWAGTSPRRVSQRIHNQTLFRKRARPGSFQGLIDSCCTALGITILATVYAGAADVYRTKEEENRILQGRVAEWIQGVSSDQDFDPRLPTV